MRRSTWIGWTRSLVAFGLVLVAAAVLLSLANTVAVAQSEGRTILPESPTGGAVPGQSLGASSDAEIWRALRRGAQGNVSIPDKRAGVLIQSEGDNWRAFRNGPLTVAGAWIVLGFIGLVALFFVIRGRIKIEAGPSGRTIERFNAVERFTHWMTAVSFIVLALTGLNLLYGRHLLLPVLGPEIFSALTIGGKYAHNYLAFPFMLGLVLMVLLWVRHNLVNRYDLIWIAELGGLFSKHKHPPARKFNAGQKVLFWAVILGGLSLSLSGLALMFPFTIAWWEASFTALNLIGVNLPTEISPMEEQQLSQIWHAFVGVVMIGIIVAHIYIGSLGMEGAFAAMGSGQVDENWAREHHAVWVAEVRGEPIPDPDDYFTGSTQPAA